jgi:ribosomal protein L11 methyltransferase
MNDSWQKLSISGDLKLLEIVSADIFQFSKGLEEGNELHIHYIEKQDYVIVNKLLQNHIFNDKINFIFNTQVKENWHLAWKDNFIPININNKITVVPDWHSEKTNGVEIKIRPGMAFGTGHHETTYLMLEQLINIVKNGISILDLGSGSGVLSIAGMKLGANSVTAVELDEDCKDNFNENLELNNLKGAIPLFIEDVLKWENFNFDIILANINKHIIVKLIPLLRKSIKADIFLTGLLNSNKDEILSIIKENNFKVKNIESRGEWMLINIFQSII